MIKSWNLRPWEYHWGIREGLEGVEERGNNIIIFNLKNKKVLKSMPPVLIKIKQTIMVINKTKQSQV